MEKNVEQIGDKLTPFFSIIIPIYNAEDYISRCVDSIKRQSIMDYEVIFVDDASQDLSSEICNHIASENPKFKYRKREHGGAAAARNYGIAESVGSYIVFIDADDYIAEQFLEKLAETISGNILPDICLFNSHYVINKNQIDKNIVFQLPENIDTSEGISSKDFFDLVTSGANHIPGSTWLAVVNKDFLKKNELQFDEKLIWSEDSDFIYRAITRANKIKCCNFCGYYYFLDNNESISKKFSLEKAMGRMDVYSKWALYFKEDPNAKKIYSERALEGLVQQMLSEYCEFLNDAIKIKNKKEKRYLYKRLWQERGLWKYCKNYKYKDYVKYGIIFGTLFQVLKRRIKFILKKL